MECWTSSVLAVGTYISSCGCCLRGLNISFQAHTQCTCHLFNIFYVWPGVSPVRELRKVQLHSSDCDLNALLGQFDDVISLVVVLSPTHMPIQIPKFCIFVWLSTQWYLCNLASALTCCLYMELGRWWTADSGRHFVNSAGKTNRWNDRTAKPNTHDDVLQRCFGIFFTKNVINYFGTVVSLTFLLMHAAVKCSFLLIANLQT